MDMTIVDADATDALGVGDGQDFMAPAGADREAAFVVGDVYSVAGGVGGDWESVVFAKAGRDEDWNAGSGSEVIEEGEEGRIHLVREAEFGGPEVPEGGREGHGMKGLVGV